MYQPTDCFGRDLVIGSTFLHYTSYGLGLWKVIHIFKNRAMICVGYSDITTSSKIRHKCFNKKTMGNFIKVLDHSDDPISEMVSFLP